MARDINHPCQNHQSHLYFWAAPGSFWAHIYSLKNNWINSGVPQLEHPTEEVLASQDQVQQSQVSFVERLASHDDSPSQPDLSQSSHTLQVLLDTCTVDKKYTCSFVCIRAESGSHGRS